MLTYYVKYYNWLCICVLLCINFFLELIYECTKEGVTNVIHVLVLTEHYKYKLHSSCFNSFFFFFSFAKTLSKIVFILDRKTLSKKTKRREVTEKKEFFCTHTLSYVLCLVFFVRRLVWLEKREEIMHFLLLLSIEWKWEREGLL